MDVLRLIATEDGAAIERWCAQRVQSAYLGEHTALCRVLGKYRCLVDTRDRSIAPHLMLDGYWETPVTQAIARHVKPGMRCIDVGANVGYFTLLMADAVGEKGSVQAWEPAPRLAALLRDTVRINGFMDRIEVVEAAAGHEPGSATLRTPDALNGGATLREDTVAQRQDVAAWQDTALVAVERLDGHLAGPVDFIKVDAEGYEPEVWSGLHGLLATSPNLAVLLEFSPFWYKDAAGFLARIRREGFSMRTVADDGGLVPFRDEDLLASRHYRMVWTSRR